MRIRCNVYTLGHTPSPNFIQDIFIGHLPGICRGFAGDDYKDAVVEDAVTFHGVVQKS
jgi:hypothetical protein